MGFLKQNSKKFGVGEKRFFGTNSEFIFFLCKKGQGNNYFNLTFWLYGVCFIHQNLII
jgi:hypothetical protein